MTDCEEIAKTNPGFSIRTRDDELGKSVGNVCENNAQPEFNNLYFT